MTDFLFSADFIVFVITNVVFCPEKTKAAEFLTRRLCFVLLFDLIKMSLSVV
jgi:hypothetical protein